ncbi:hypothetical protein EYF80_068125 [Liparis tanakae]|uniref:Uncharacterized protein n=1 Tax=Liparis tanakae TaxID=230148 RepID=A0A4Z2DYZ0_9TELE|nr:hypothetical protein EYF80_068125 [Liparis tanakae]
MTRDLLPVQSSPSSETPCVTLMKSLQLVIQDSVSTSHNKSRTLQSTSALTSALTSDLWPRETRMSFPFRPLSLT